MHLLKILFAFPGAGGCANYSCSSPITPQNQPQPQPANPQTNGVPLPSNMIISQIKQSQSYGRPNQSHQGAVNILKSQIISSNHPQSYNQIIVADSSALGEQVQCQGCIPDSVHFAQNNYSSGKDQNQKIFHNDSAPNSQPGTPSSSMPMDDPVTSSTYSDKHSNQSSPDSRPIQGGTISTSNVSPVDGSPGPATPPIKVQTKWLITRSNFIITVFVREIRLFLF